MSIYLPEIDSNTLDFPPIENALSDPDGLLAMGGDLSTERIISAYSKGIFPWFTPEQPILWWSPSSRAVIYPQAFSPAKSLRKCFRKQNWAVSINRATNEVIELCANTRAEDETWITNEMVLAYQSLAEQGHCHSIEVWLDGQLVGGLYGLLIGKVFCGESMFSLTSNASKIAFWHLTLWLSENQPVLIDCQMMNPHLQSLGAVEIARADFRTKLLNLSKQVINPVQTEPKWMVKR